MALVLDGTNGVSGVDGTASNPAIEGTDSNTGIFYPSADTVAIGTGGTEALRVNSSQQVGIGTTSILGNSVLNVAQGVVARNSGATLPYFQTYNSNAGTDLKTWRFGGNSSGALTFETVNDAYSSATGRMTLDASGNLGVVVTDPATYGGVFVARPVSEGNFAVRSLAGIGGSGAGVGLDALNNAANSVADFGFRGATLQFRTAGGERARITSDGDFLIGRTGQWSTGRLCIQKRSGNYNTVEAGQGDGGGYNFYSWAANNGGTYYHAIFTEAGTARGSITSNGSTTSYVTTSDYRLKENVQPMTGALAKVSQLKPCTYSWKDSRTDGEGFIAHELGEVCPQAVVGQKDAVDAEGNPVYQGIDTSFLVATLTAAIQELNAKVEAQAAEIAALKGAA